jgi:hypothetical protein
MFGFLCLYEEPELNLTQVIARRRSSTAKSHRRTSGRPGSRSRGRSSVPSLGRAFSRRARRRHSRVGTELGAAEPQPPWPEPVRRDLPSSDGLVQRSHRGQAKVRGRLLRGEPFARAKDGAWRRRHRASR